MHPPLVRCSGSNGNPGVAGGVIIIVMPINGAIRGLRAQIESIIAGGRSPGDGSRSAIARADMSRIGWRRNHASRAVPTITRGASIAAGSSAGRIVVFGGRVVGWCPDAAAISLGVGTYRIVDRAGSGFGGAGISSGRRICYINSFGSYIPEPFNSVFNHFPAERSLARGGWGGGRKIKSDRAPRASD